MKCLIIFSLFAAVTATSHIDVTFEVHGSIDELFDGSGRDSDDNTDRKTSLRFSSMSGARTFHEQSYSSIEWNAFKVS